MAIPPNAETCLSDVCEPAAVLRDEVAEHRVRRIEADRRRTRYSRNDYLADPEREDYELRLDAYEVELAEGRERRGGAARVPRAAGGVRRPARRRTRYRRTPPRRRVVPAPADVARVNNVRAAR